MTEMIDTEFRSLMAMKTTEIQKTKESKESIRKKQELIDEIVIFFFLKTQTLARHSG